MILLEKLGGTVQMDRFKLFDSYYGLNNDIAQPGVAYNFTNCHFKNNNYAIQLNADKEIIYLFLNSQRIILPLSFYAKR